ncbi:ALF repeat-containing protein [Streptomyces anandii]|uniref:ALF repeat-containing protein n=1 Tax=Streptomyces anandii TaxID=285454 RepID=UPI003700700A
MRPTRAALTVAASALTPALLFSAPAFASDSTASSPAGVAAVSNTDSSTTTVDQMSDDDVRVAIMRILADPSTGKAVRAAAQEAMDGTIEDQRYFLETGRWTAQAEDDRVAIFRILADPSISDALRTAAEQALDTGTPEALRYFVEHGQYEVDA